MRALGLRSIVAVASVAAAAAGEGGIVQGESSAAVFLFEWSWSDIAKECEVWLGPKGFKAVQVSPPSEHRSGDQWWTRYQPVTYKLTSRSGDEHAFADMVRRCRAAGVEVYVDAVFNHVAEGRGTGVAGSRYGDPPRSTPIFRQKDMHHLPGDLGGNCAITDWNNEREVQTCDFVGLPDLCTGCEYVQETISGYINHLSTLGVAGIRIDAAKHIHNTELAQILNRTDQKLFRWQEVVCCGIGADQYFHLGRVGEFAYYENVLKPSFATDGRVERLGTVGPSWGMMPSDKAVVFIDNQDTQRHADMELTFKKGRLYELASIFMLAHPYGYPMVMSSYHFDDKDQGPPKTPVHGAGSPVACSSQPNIVATCTGWRRWFGICHDEAPTDNKEPWVCEHRWTGIANMVAWRRSAGTAGISDFQAFGGDTIAFCRGSAACVALNRQASSEWSVQLKFDLPPGVYCDVIRSEDALTCPKIHVPASGVVSLQVPAMGAVAVHVGKRAQFAEEVLYE